MLVTKATNTSQFDVTVLQEVVFALTLVQTVVSVMSVWARVDATFACPSDFTSTTSCLLVTGLGMNTVTLVRASFAMHVLRALVLAFLAVVTRSAVTFAVDVMTLSTVET